MLYSKCKRKIPSKLPPKSIHLKCQTQSVTNKSNESIALFNIAESSTSVIKQKKVVGKHYEISFHAAKKNDKLIEDIYNRAKKC